MRQALDHLAYALARRLQGVDPPPNKDNTGFPITTTETHLKNAVYGKVAPKKHLPEAVYAALKAVQPHPGQNHLLWVLHELDNLDKHRFLPVVAGVAQGASYRIRTFSGSHFVGPRLGLLEPQTPVVEYIPDPEAEMDMQLDFTGAIALDKTSSVAPGEFVVPLLSAIRTFILREVFAPLEAFL
jgi:hypothetical protein